MEAEHFDDIIRKKLENIEPPRYEDSMWTKLRGRIVVPSRFDYKGAIAASSLLLNVILVAWILQKDQPAFQPAQQSFQQSVVYDTLVYKTVSYDTIHRTVYVDNYQYRDATRSDEAANIFNSKNLSPGNNDIIAFKEYQSFSPESNSLTTDNDGTLVPALSETNTDSLMTEQQKDSLQVAAVKTDSSTLVADTEEKRHPRVYKQRREVFISPVVTVPVVNLGDASKVRSNFLALELSYMPFNRVGVFGRISRYHSEYSVKDEKFRPEESGGYNNNLYNYENSSVSRVAFGYNLGVRGIIYRARYWHATADIGFGQFFHDRTSITNRLEETSSGKMVFSELPRQNFGYSYLFATLGAERPIGYRMRVRLGLDIARNLNSATTLDHIDSWAGVSAGLTYQLK